ncbi:MAG TPA: 4-(cytidine 5'-diphospho)-2-C-methyl-D-erythritol kinase [Terriglobales bacterium]|nr:4-(cytidine 5'-diphospho)-2-C-methyl-D-erythritol kinase [Terriglobales bacterium]
MRVAVRSFAKINLGLRIGPLRPDGFHELRTVYQTIALHDIIHVQVGRGSGIEILCEDPRVPKDESNTCHRIVQLAMPALKARGRVVIEIEKRLPVQGGLGGASANAVATLIGLERALKKNLPAPERLRIGGEVGSDIPLFLIGGTILGIGHGEEVYPVPDLPAIPCVIATPEIGVSTPEAFADWDALTTGGPQGLKPVSGVIVGTAEAAPFPDTTQYREEGHDLSRAENVQQKLAAGETAELRSSRTAKGDCRHVSSAEYKLTLPPASDRMTEFGRVLSAWLGGQSQGKYKLGRASSGVPVSKGRGRAETPLLDLVRTGIENDFERVVFPKYPELREVKRVLEREGAVYASLSGSGSAIYGLFASREAAVKAAARLCKDGIPAVATTTLTRQQYWNKIFD